MEDIKFIHQETIYLNLINGMTGRFFTNFPHIFFPKFKLDKMSLDTYQKFTEYFLEMIMLNNTAFSTFDLNKNTSETIESMYKKYVSETEHNLKELYDPDTKKVFTRKLNATENKNKKDTKLVFPNFGHEPYINTFSTGERHSAFEFLDSMGFIIKKMNNRIIFQLYSFFEEILKYISKHSKLLEETYIKKLDFKDKKELLNKKFEESHKSIKEYYPKLPTYKQYAMIIDQNCHIGSERGLSKFLKNAKYKNFNDTRNSIVHDGDEYEIKKPLTDFFYVVKEMLDYIYNKEEIIKKMDKVLDQVYSGDFIQ